MTTKDHGHWTMYTPATLPANAPTHAIFTRRDGDGVDWYDYVHSGKNFAADTVKMTLRTGVVCAAVTDPTMLFPEDMDVAETDAVSGDPQEMFGRKIYNPATQTFSDPPPPTMEVPPSPPGMQALEARMSLLEAKLGSR